MPYVPDCPEQSRILILCPGVLVNIKLSRKFKKKIQLIFLRPIEGERLVKYSCIDDRYCIHCHVPIISGVPVVIDPYLS